MFKRTRIFRVIREHQEVERPLELHPEPTRMSDGFALREQDRF